MKYRDREQLKEAIKKILSADQKSVENLPEGLVKQEIKKIRKMEE